MPFPKRIIQSKDVFIATKIFNFSKSGKDNGGRNDSLSIKSSYRTDLGDFSSTSPRKVREGKKVEDSGNHKVLTKLKA